MLQAYQIQAITSALGDVLTAFGGVWETRTTAAAQAGDAALTVESTVGMQPSGAVCVGGDTYTYAAIAGSQLTGMAYTSGGVAYAGMVQSYPALTTVVDVSGNRSVLDAVKQTYFLGTATGDDLSVIGRNLGVPRLPQVQDDAQYHQLIKAIAYGPRGTMYCVSLALEALLGAGNFGVYQTPDKPGVVTVVMPYAQAGVADIATATFLDRRIAVTLAGTTFNQSNVPPGCNQVYNLRAATRPDHKDYTVVTNTNASVAPAGLTLPGITASAADAGATVILSGSTAQRPGGGNNNGTYTLGAIVGTPAAGATLPLMQASGSGVLQANGTLIAASALFTYPNDLGKTLRITAGPAQGTYTVAKLLEPTTNRDLSTYATPLTTACAQAVLSPAPANAADAVPFVLDASLVAESNLTYQLGGRCLQGGTLPAPLTVPAAGSYVVSADYAAGGALHATGAVEVPFTADGTAPVPVGYPIYLSDPSQALAAYVSDLLAAGIELDFAYT